jgi:hypothetical protein
VVTFFQTSVPPVLKEETIALFPFMAPADESKRLCSVPVRLKKMLGNVRR